MTPQQINDQLDKMLEEADGDIYMQTTAYDVAEALASFYMSVESETIAQEQEGFHVPSECLDLAMKSWEGLTKRLETETRGLRYKLHDQMFKDQGGEEYLLNKLQQDAGGII